MSAFLGIDTSNYTTSAAVVAKGAVLVNSKRPVSVRPGERGIRQNESVFSHVKNLPEVIEAVASYHPQAIGVSARPRDVEGSYMPCFLAGVSAATMLSQVLNIPLSFFSHQAGHVRAAMYSAGRNDLVGGRCLAFHVSGGTTEVLLYEKGAITCLGGSLDIHAGQLIDRVGVSLGLAFPCGPALEQLADFDALAELKGRVTPMATVSGLACHFSGLENKAADYLGAGYSPGVVAAFVLASVEKTLSLLAQNALKQVGNLVVLFSGGVMGNRYLQKTIGQKMDAWFAEPAFSSDNAAGIALLCEERYLSHG